MINARNDVQASGVDEAVEPFGPPSFDPEIPLSDEAGPHADAIAAAVAAATAAASAANVAASAAAAAAKAANTVLNAVQGGEGAENPFATPLPSDAARTSSGAIGNRNGSRNGTGHAPGYEGGAESSPTYAPPASGKTPPKQSTGPDGGLAALPPPEGWVPNALVTDGSQGATGQWKAQFIERGRFHTTVWEGDQDEALTNAPVPLRVEWTPPPFFHLYASLEQNFSRLAGYQKGSLLIGVTSAILGEGKTTCALHLALSAARSTQKRVCLIDLSLGEDDLCRRMGAAPAPGGSVSLIEENGVLGVMEISTPGNLAFIPAGKVPMNPALMSRSKIVEELFTTLRGEYDLIIADMPAVVTDNAVPLASLMDGVVLVMQTGATPRAMVNDAIEKLGRDRIAGVVLNRMAPNLVQENLPTTRRDKKSGRNGRG